MYQSTQCIHLIAIQENIHFHNITIAVANRMIIERCITTGLRFQFIIKIKNDLGKWHFKYQLNTGLCQVTLIYENTTFTQTQCHYVTNVFRLGNDLCFDIRFFYTVYPYRVRHLRRIVYDHLLAFRSIGNKTNVGNGCDNRLVKLPLQTFLYDLHMQQS